MATIVSNPNTLVSAGTEATTVKSYMTPCFFCELRRYVKGSTVYFWTRVTVRQSLNYTYIQPVCSVGGTSVQYGWSSGDNHTVGSIYCSKAIGISGYPTQVSSFSGYYGIGAGTPDAPGTVNFTSY